jgi:hypothetical protein
MLKSFLNKLVPGFKKNDQDLKFKFKKIFKENLFGGGDSVSGPGSDALQTRIIKEEIPNLMRKYQISSLIDAPCGDFFWMRDVNLKGMSYIGCDIVQELIDKNNKQFSGSERKFICVNIVNEVLPKSDIILSRDCLVHLSNEQIFKALNNFVKSGSQYLLTTTSPDLRRNLDLGSNIWRPINLSLSPFLFNTPLEIINEGCTENDGIYRDKSLALWKLEDVGHFIADKSL